MASPDAMPYIDLVLDARDAQDLLDEALTDATSKLPGWTPREGNTEVVLLEANALLAAEVIYSLNQVPSAAVQAILALYGITRDDGAAATATVTFTAADALGHDIPAGTRVTVPLPVDPSESAIMATTVGAAIAPGSTTVTVPVVAEDNGTDLNGALTGTALGIVDALAYVDTAVLATDVAGGRDAEADLDYFERATQRFGRLTETLVLPAQFTAFALEQPGVGRALTIDNYLPPSGTPGSDAGHVTVAVLDTTGAVLSSDAKADLQAAMQAICHSQLTVHVIDPTFTTQAVTVAVHMEAGQVAADVQAAIAEALNAYLSPLGWPWAGVVRRNELVSLIDQVPGVAYVDAGSPTTPGADVTLTGAAPIAVAGTLTITVA